MPVSGLTGAFLKDVVSEDQCPWFRGPALIQYLDDMSSLNRASDGPVRVPVVDRYKVSNVWSFNIVYILFYLSEPWLVAFGFPYCKRLYTYTILPFSFSDCPDYDTKQFNGGALGECGVPLHCHCF